MVFEHKRTQDLPSLRLNVEREKTPPTPGVGARFIMSCIVTTIMLGAALYIILSQSFTEADVKWAYGMVGIIIGHWLSPHTSENK